MKASFIAYPHLFMFTFDYSLSYYLLLECRLFKLIMAYIESIDYTYCKFR